MDVQVTVASADLDDEKVAEATRELLKEIRGNADPKAQLMTQEAPDDSRGAYIIFGQIAVALVSSGAIKSFIQSLFAFLGLRRKLEIEVQNSLGEKLKIKSDFIDRFGEEKAMALVETFLTRST